jgi:hypothetical protein
LAAVLDAVGQMMTYADCCPSRHARMGVDDTTGVPPTVGVFVSSEVRGFPCLPLMERAISGCRNEFSDDLSARVAAAAACLTQPSAPGSVWRSTSPTMLGCSASSSTLMILMIEAVLERSR